MITEIEYALMAGASYIATRSAINRFPIPLGWTAVTIPPHVKDDATGFEAIAFQKGTEIVISFAGTKDALDTGDNQANIGLATGASCATQLVQAAEYYLSIKNDPRYQGYNITLTGHSLGGGLAALVGVFFRLPATTFDQAPFANSAQSNSLLSNPFNFLSTDVAQELKTSLLGAGYSEKTLESLSHYLLIRSVGGNIPNSNLINNIRVEGEFLSSWIAVNQFSAIGNPPTIFTPGKTSVGGTDLHAMSLLTAFLQSDASANTVAGQKQSLSAATLKLTDLLAMMFDKNLYYNDPNETNNPQRNFLEHLVRHQTGGVDGVAAGGDGMVTRFTADLWKLAQEGGITLNENIWGYRSWNNVSKALTAFAMEKYYNENQSNVCYGTELFTNLEQSGMGSNGIWFDTAAVVGAGNAISTAKGYTQYFQNHINYTSTYSGFERSQINRMAGKLRDWYVQTGALGMSVTDSQNRGAFMLGGKEADILTGGAGDDLLVGNMGENILYGGEGNDMLVGGAEKDTLMGGTGFDTYYVNRKDIIWDADGQGAIYFNTSQPTGGNLDLHWSYQYGASVWKDSTGNLYAMRAGNSPTGRDQLLVSQGYYYFIIENFNNGDLGINLSGTYSPPPPRVYTPPPKKTPTYDPSQSWVPTRIDPLVLDLNGNGQIDAVGSDTSTAYFDFNGDGISEKSGWVSAADGMLALDGNRNGAIDGLSELFGSATQDGFAELAGLDSNLDGQITEQDAAWLDLKVWQDTNQDGIAQSGELHTLAALNISAINLTNTPTSLLVADNLITSLGSFTQNGQTQLAADINLAVNFTLTDSNPNRPLDQAPVLTADIFALPWLRGYGAVKSLHIAFQESGSLQQAAVDLIAQGYEGIFAGFDGFMAQWSGLAAAHAAHGIQHSRLTIEDKVWMMEAFVGQSVFTGTIEAANFAALGLRWDTDYIDTQYQTFRQREAISFAIQAAAMEWLPSLYYSLEMDAFVAIDAGQLQTGLQAYLNTVNNEADANFAALVLAQLKVDGVDLAPEALKQAIATSVYAPLFNSALDFAGENIWMYTETGFNVALDRRDWFIVGSSADDTLDGGAGNDVLNAGSGNDVVRGEAGNDHLHGGSGDDILMGGNGNDTLNGGAGNDVMNGGSSSDAVDFYYTRYRYSNGNDTYLFGRGAGQDVVIDLDFSQDNLDTVQMAVDILPSDVVMTRDQHNLYLTLNNPDGTMDQLTLQNWYLNDASKVEQVVFADGTVWDVPTLNVKANPPTEGADVLYDTSWIDTLRGLGGDDLYVVNNAEDVVIEAVNGGNDTVVASTSYTLPDNVENLTIDSSVGVFDVYGRSAWIDATGNAGANHLRGTGGYNRLDGGAGADIMEGGGGLDIYVVDNVGDQVIEDTVGVGIVEASIDYTLGNALENLTLTGLDNINGTGNAQNNVLTGNVGDNRLDGGAGADTLAGGEGNDYYLSNSGDIIIEAVGQGIDTIERDFSNYRNLEDNVEHLRLVGFAVYAHGNALDNVIIGNALNNQLAGWAGNDQIEGGLGDDSLFGGAGVDTLVGGQGDDYLSGEVDADTLIGGQGNDDYEIDNVGDVIIELAGEGDDIVRSTVSFTLGDNVEMLALDGATDLTATGNDLDNALWGNVGNNVLTGGCGVDSLAGGAGNDVYVYNRGDDQDTIDNTDVLGATDTLRFGAGITDNDVLGFQAGSSLYLKIKGSTDKIALFNYYAADTLSGTTITDHKIDRVEFANGVVWDQAMIQTVVDRANSNLAPVINSYLPSLQARANTLFTYNVAANVITDPNPWDSVTYSAELPDGSPLPAWLTFDASTRTFTGTPAAGDVGTFDFILWGTDNYGFGSGEYVTLNIGAPNRAPVLATALLDQAAAQGAAFKYILPTNAFTDPDADTLIYSATLADDSTLPSWLSFNAATRTFSGTPSTLGTISVKVTAADPYNTRVSDVFDLSVAVQNLTLNGTTAADTLNGGAGNDTLGGLAGNDVLNGYAGNDKLDGGAGADKLLGGLGDDLYVVDNTGDLITENAGEGADSVQSAVTYTLASNLENLTLTGTAKINATGNTLNNTLLGNAAINTLTGYAGNDTLNGGAGADKLLGGLGDDLYVVDNTGDVVTELVNEGLDSVQSTVTYTLATNLENLTLMGTAAINGTGNTVDNALIGNTAINTLTGGAGNDWLSGMLGNDVLAGGTGNDILQGGAGNDVLTDTAGVNLFDGGAGADSLTGNTANEIFIGGTGNDTITTGTGADIVLFNRGDGMDIVNGGIGTDNTLSLGKGIAYTDLALSKVNNDLIVEVGAGEQLTFSNWYATTANNKNLLNLQILADAMANFDATSNDPLLNQAVQTFNFSTLVAGFDQARGANSTFQHWSMTNSLLAARLSASDSQALGGDIAHQYATAGTLGGMSLSSAQNVLNTPTFGSQAQTLQPLAGLQGAGLRLAA